MIRSGKPVERSLPTFYEPKVAMTTILGISPGTRRVGIAILENKSLVDWQTLSFPKPWTDAKVEDITEAIKSIILYHRITHVALKVPPKHKTTPNLILVLKALKRLFKRQKVHLTVYSISELKNYCQQSNKDKMAEFISKKEPYLDRIYRKNLISQVKYYTPVFEAISAAFTRSFTL